jgi:hypothetical protein
MTIFLPLSHVVLYQRVYAKAPQGAVAVSVRNRAIISTDAEEPNFMIRKTFTQVNIR